MSHTELTPISELSDAELDTVAAAGFKVQIAAFNYAYAVQQNNQLNVAVLNGYVGQGGSQTNNNNAGNQG